MKPNGVKVGVGYLALTFLKHCFWRFMDANIPFDVTLTQRQKDYKENSTNATKEQK